MDYNPFSPEVWENPYPYYAYLRHHAPIYEVPGVGLWAISRYDDVYSVLR
jgi:cytochrome P450